MKVELCYYTNSNSAIISISHIFSYMHVVSSFLNVLYMVNVVSGDQRTLLRYSSNRMQILSYPCPLPNQTEGAANDTIHTRPRVMRCLILSPSFVVSINPISILMKTSTQDPEDSDEPISCAFAYLADANIIF